MGCRLYVGNLSWTVTEADLKELFRDFTVTDVKLIVDRETHKSRGFGFVSLGSEKQAQDAAAELDGTDYGGRTLRIREANERPDNGAERKRGGKRDDYSRAWRK